MFARITRYFKPRSKIKILKSIETLDPEKEVFPDTLILHASFKVLVHCVENNKYGGVSRIEGSEGAKVSIDKLYDYWTIERPKLLFNENRAFEEMNKLEFTAAELKRKSRDEEMLTRLCKVRKYLRF